MLDSSLELTMDGNRSAEMDGERDHEDGTVRGVQEGGRMPECRWLHRAEFEPKCLALPSIFCSPTQNCPLGTGCKVIGSIVFAMPDILDLQQEREKSVQRERQEEDMSSSLSDTTSGRFLMAGRVPCGTPTETIAEGGRDK